LTILKNQNLANIYDIFQETNFLDIQFQNLENSHSLNYYSINNNLPNYHKYQDEKIFHLDNEILDMLTNYDIYFPNFQDTILEDIWNYHLSNNFDIVVKSSFLDKDILMM